jgi:hypothetical protein
LVKAAGQGFQSPAGIFPLPWGDVQEGRPPLFPESPRQDGASVEVAAASGFFYTRDDEKSSFQG